MFLNYASNFIDSNRTSPFFLIYAHNLIQHPWSPTPDDPDYAGWDPAVDDEANEDKKYFPGMVAYMDKIIGKLLNKVQAAGLSDRTVIIFTSDNATAKHIKSQYKGETVNGAKDSTTRAGLNVPLVAYGPGIVLSGKTDTSLTDLTDILPTLAGIAGIPKPSTWGPLDGTTFYDNLTGDPLQQRKSVYCYWPGYFKRPTKSFVYDYDYKLYDSASGGKFYNIRADVYEQHPLKSSQLTPDEKDIKRKFKRILDQSSQ
jgi:arylsulfatase A-like enzyme